MSTLPVPERTFTMGKGYLCTWVQQNGGRRGSWRPPPLQVIALESRLRDARVGEVRKQQAEAVEDSDSGWGLTV